QTTCISGHCIAQCSGGKQLCSGVCRNTTTEPQNCGACGHVCGAGLTCVNGQCQVKCPLGYSSSCSGHVGECIDLRFDPQNCGVCGHVCPSFCNNGQCVGACPMGQSACGLLC